MNPWQSDREGEWEAVPLNRHLADRHLADPRLAAPHPEDLHPVTPVLQVALVAPHTITVAVATPLAILTTTLL